MDAASILKNIKDGHLGPIYILEGEEPMYTDKIMKAFEEEALPEEAKDFNQIVLYGNEVDYKQVIAEAQRMPMFGDRTLVLLKEANQMKTLNELVIYLENPNPTTTLVIEVRGKKLDGRGALSKLAKKKYNVFESPKIKDETLPAWITQYGKEIGLTIPGEQAEKLSMYLGNDLQKIANEFEKIKISEPNVSTLTPELIEKYIGISREFNLFELTDTFFAGNTDKLASMLNYFGSDPKNVAMPLAIASFYGYLSKAFTSYYVKDFAEMKKYGIWDKHAAFKNKHGMVKIHRLLHVLNEYAMKSVGIDVRNVNASELLLEMIGKMKLIMDK